MPPGFSTTNATYRTLWQHCLTLPLSVSWVRRGSEPKGDPGAGLQRRTVLAEVQCGSHTLTLTLQLSLTCRCRPADGRVYRETDTFLAASTHCCQHRAITPGFNATASIGQNILQQHSLLFKCLGSEINTFIQHGHIKLIKSDSKNIYNITKNTYFK